ncbi:replicative DNA helicase [Lactovum miscens]|uniref:Replicative DNA helicase n=1 Tax=Lactovum miscens TaxID=190387 RepID=A0A841C2X9_9LACT|nr:replicative DNA helicase [Lactovum miscens]MBB5888316.1 replicative DNA helicase [Lactovum miscens]
MAEFDFVKQTPRDLQAEKAVLGAILLENERLLDIKEFVSVEDFYLPAYRTIFSTMENLNDNSLPIDIVTLNSKLEEQGDLELVGGVTGLSELTDEYPLPSRATYYAQIIKERSQQRAVIRELSETIDRAYAMEDSAEDLIANTENQIAKISEGQSRSGFVKMSEIINENFAAIEERAKQKSRVTGLATRFFELDRLTTGFHDEELIILAARPGVGKTAFALNIAENVATTQNKAVVIFSLEMGVESLVDRMIAATGPINGMNIRTGQLLDQEWENLIHATNTLSKAQIYMDDTPGIRVGEIRSKCRRLAREVDNLGLVVIDYLQLIQGSGREGRQQEVSEISRQLKILAKELKVPVIALSQLSRSVEQRDNKRPRLSDLRESGSIEQDADIVAFLYREDYYAREGEEQPEDLDDSVEVIIEKNRSGSRGTAKLRFIKEYNKFANIEANRIEN